MWPTLILIVRINVGFKKLMSSTLVGLFSVVTDEHVGFEKLLVVVQDVMIIINHFRGSYKLLCLAHTC